MSGIQMALFGSARLILDTQTVTRGNAATGVNPTLEYSGWKNLSPTIGSIADGTSNVYSGASITQLYFFQEGYDSPPVGYTTRQVIFRLGSAVANSGWSLITIGTTTFSRSSATFTTGTGFSQWVWNIPIADPFVSEGNPFSATTLVTWS